jgi:hypothetical protein
MEMHSREIAQSEPTTGWVVVVRLLYLEQVSRMLRHRQAECAMMMPELGRVIGIVADMLTMHSCTLAPEQQSKSEQKLLNHGDCKMHRRDIYACPAAATSTTRGRLGRCVSSISS